MNKIQIMNRSINKVIFEYEKENNTVKDTVEEAIRQKVSLANADLKKANLEGLNLEEVDFEDANLRCANLKNTNLKNANLEGAYIEAINLMGANLKNVKLREACIYADDDEIEIDCINEIIEEFKKNTNAELMKVVLRPNISLDGISIWKYGLLIHDYKLKFKK